MAIPRSEDEERVTNLELFFDLVFVFAITQVTALMAGEPTWAGVIAFRLRNVGSVNKQRVVTAAVLAALIPVAHRVDALPALAITAAATCGLIAYEAIRFREARDRVRHRQEVAVS